MAPGARLAARRGDRGACTARWPSHDSDPHFAPEEPSGEALGLVAAAIDEEIAATFATLPDDDALGAVAHRAEEIRDLVQELVGVGPAGLAIRTHGDYHLGQVLWSTTATGS